LTTNSDWSERTRETLLVVRKTLLALVAVLFLVSTALYAGTINRGAKTAGGTSFTTGAIIASEMNTDLDTIYTVINGNLDNANINAAAAVVVSKLDQTCCLLDADIVGDYSNNAAEQDNTVDPGTSGAAGNTLPTNLEKELENLRFKLHQLGIGTSSGAIASGAETNTTSTWIDGPYRPGNLIYNGGFDVLDDLTTSADGDGWTRVLTPTTLGASALTESEGQGDGNGLQVVDTGAALAGVQQTLDGLRADAKYLLTGMVYDTTGTCRLLTSGADTNELTLTSDDSSAWQRLSGTFETDSTPADVIIQLLAVAQSDDCIFNNIGVFEINTDPVAPGGKVHCYDSITTSTLNHYSGSADTDAGITCTVTPPGPGYMITVRGKLIAENETASSEGFEGDLRQACAATTTVDLSIEGGHTPTGNVLSDMAELEFFYVNDSPTAGQACTYTLRGRPDSANAWSRNDHDGDVNGTATTWIDVIMEPVG